MQGNAIQLVSQALRDFLQSALAAQGIPGPVYVGPLDDTDAAGASVVLFLYRIVANADLRNAEHRLPGATPTDPPVVIEGALPLDLYYLLTGWTAPSGQGGGELDSLRVLGCAMQALNDSANLTGLPVQGETVRLSLEPVASEEMSRIWTLFPTANYRTSVVYLASPVWVDPAAPAAPAAPVTDELYAVGHGAP
jgi:hypothetical protein